MMMMIIKTIVELLNKMFRSRANHLSNRQHIYNIFVNIFEFQITFSLYTLDKIIFFLNSFFELQNELNFILQIINSFLHFYFSDLSVYITLIVFSLQHHFISAIGRSVQVATLMCIVYLLF